MKKTIYTFNSLLRTYNKYRRKLANLRKANKNERRQHILQKHLAKLYEKLTFLKMSIKLSTAAASVVVGTLAFIPQNANAQSFSAKQINPFSLTNAYDVSAPTFADLDGDGDLDMLSGSGDYYYNYYTYNYEYYFKYYQNTGTATNPVFAAPVNNPFGITAPADDMITPTFVDIDNDGDMDLFYGDRSGDFFYMENVGSSTVPVFGTPQTNPFLLSGISSYFTSRSIPTFADLDGDGDFDLLSGGNNGDFFYFQNTGSATAPSFGPVQVNPFSLIGIGYYGRSAPDLIDIDGDGDFDLLSGNSNGDFYYFQNTGTATAPAFATSQTNPFSLSKVGVYSYTGNSKPTFADIDNDGDMDLMAGDDYGDFSFYRRCLPTADTISPTVACSYTSPSGQLHLTSGSFTDVIPNATGCDSIITINLTVNPLIDQTVSSTNPVACNSGSTTIDLGSSQSGINYFLRNNANDTIVDGPVAGTGTGLSFNTGTINAPTTYNVYGVGTAPSTGLVFDGIDDYVDAGTGINLTNSSFSIEFWAKKNMLITGNDNHIIGLGETTTTNNALHIGFRGSNQFTFAFFGNDLDASSTLADTNWHHWAVTFDEVSKARTIYRDGVQVANDVSSSNFIGTGNLKIGRAYFANNNNFNGNLDEVRVWNGAKTVSEINATMNTCLSGTETGLLAYYQFENGAGSSTLTDISPNGNNGTLTNMNPATDWGTGSSVCSTCNIEMTQTITINVGQHSTSSITETACNSYTSPSGNFTWVTSGVFSDTIPNVSGCDSVITVNLTINTVDNTTTLNVNTVTANQTGATYQWLDCNNANAVIIGAIAQSFTPTVTGNYAVEVTMNGCSDTSACVNVIITSINELALAGIKIYPNPVNDNIFIELANLAQATKITIVSIDGKEVYSNATINSNKLAIDAAAWSKGVYFITITSDKNSNTMKLIKQ